MEIPRQLLDWLTDEVGALSSEARQRAEIALDKVIAEWDGSDIAALREASIAVLDSVAETYTGLCAARGAEFYDATRSLQGASGRFRALAESGYEQAAMRGAVKALIQGVVDTEDTGAFKRRALDRVDEECRRAANVCIARNGMRDPAKPSYARVPSGDSCGFCLMLSSFGFHYRTEEAASHGHTNCDCRVVSEFGEGLVVEGYDPDEMYEHYNDCLDTLGGREGIRADWEALPEDERARYIERHGGSESKAFDAYLNRRMAAEIELRDAEWFRSGIVPEITYSSKKVEERATSDERKTAARLADVGIKPHFIQDFKWVTENGRKRKVGLPDLDNGIEIKNITTSANAWGAMKNHFDSMAHKEDVRCMLVDNTDSKHISDEDLIEAIDELVGDYPTIPSIRLLLKSGKFIIYK